MPATRDAGREGPSGTPGAECERAVLHEAYSLPALTSRRFTHHELWGLLGTLADEARGIVREQIGSSAEGRPLYSLTFGRGPVRVLAWSQMHGDESTHTMALADLVAFFAREPDDPRVAGLAERITFVAVPMLNPDGAERFRRANAQGIDINRDAGAWLTPEMRALRDLFERVRPDFGLNLHDQDPRKRVGKSHRLTALALLANPFNEALEDDDARLRAKRLCAVVARAVEPLVGGHVGRFREEFNPRGSGEFMARNGTSTLLLECGAWTGDPEKQFLRTVSFVAILAALEAIADASYAAVPLSGYEALEEDDSSVFDVVVRGGTVVVPGLEPYRADVGINFRFPLERRDGYVAAVGALDDFAAREEVRAEGLFLHPRAEALRSTGGTRPVLGSGSPAYFDVRAGPGPSDRLALSIRSGVPYPRPSDEAPDAARAAAQ